jgi:hypothetical protein
MEYCALSDLTNKQTNKKDKTVQFQTGLPLLAMSRRSAPPVTP